MSQPGIRRFLKAASFANPASPTNTPAAGSNGAPRTISRRPLAEEDAHRKKEIARLKNSWGLPARVTNDTRKRGSPGYQSVWIAGLWETVDLIAKGKCAEPPGDHIPLECPPELRKAG